MTHIRQAAVSGTFYPANPPLLRQMVAEFLAEAEHALSDTVPKAIIAPHAGYIYSGPIAGSAFKTWQGRMEGVRRIILIGPAHTMAVRGLATVTAAAFQTPFGEVTVDQEAVAQLLPLTQVHGDDRAHRREHCLEVMLPFLQTIGKDFTIVPLLAGQTTGADVAEVLAAVWGGPETRILISSDLSHYHEYRTARQLDQATAMAIEQLQPNKLGQGSACGRLAIQGLLLQARTKGMQATTIDLRNSGDTAGPKDRVVGYGAFMFT